jgi:hypothetical protein
VLYKSYLKGGGALLFLILMFLAYNHFKGVYDSAIQSAREAGRQAEVVRSQEALLKQRQEIDFQNQQQRLANMLERDRLEAELRLLRQQRREIENRLYKDNELDILLQARPDWILSIIQEGTDARLEELERVTQ